MVTQLDSAIYFQHLRKKSGRKRENALVRLELKDRELVCAILKVGTDSSKSLTALLAGVEKPPMLRREITRVQAVAVAAAALSEAWLPLQGSANRGGVERLFGRALCEELDRAMPTLELVKSRAGELPSEPRAVKNLWKTLNIVIASEVVKARLGKYHDPDLAELLARFERPHKDRADSLPKMRNMLKEDYSEIYAWAKQVAN